MLGRNFSMHVGREAGSLGAHLRGLDGGYDWKACDERVHERRAKALDLAISRLSFNLVASTNVISQR